MPDPNHVAIVEDALNASHREVSVEMTFGEAILFHTLMQVHGIDYTGEDRFIPLMERSKARVVKIGQETQ